jgi:signal peptidase II
MSTTPGKLSMGLILGGTVGNLIDRLRVGHVTDFIDIGIWPSFNVADSSVVVGVLLLAFLLIKER